MVPISKNGRDDPQSTKSSAARTAYRRTGDAVAAFIVLGIGDAGEQRQIGRQVLAAVKPAENEPAEPNALTQSLQLACSLIPSSTLPSTRLVIIWLKRCPARSLIDPAPEPVAAAGGALVLGVEVWG